MSGVLHPMGPEPAQTYWVRRGVLLAVVLLLATIVVFGVANLTKAAVATAPPPPIPPAVDQPHTVDHPASERCGLHAPAGAHAVGHDRRSLGDRTGIDERRALELDRRQAVGDTARAKPSRDRDRHRDPRLQAGRPPGHREG